VENADAMQYDEQHSPLGATTPYEEPAVETTAASSDRAMASGSNVVPVPSEPTVKIGDAVIVAAGEFEGAVGTVGSVVDGTASVDVNSTSVYYEHTPITISLKSLVPVRMPSRGTGGAKGKGKKQQKGKKWR